MDKVAIIGPSAKKSLKRPSTKNILGDYTFRSNVTHLKRPSSTVQFTLRDNNIAECNFTHVDSIARREVEGEFLRVGDDDDGGSN